MEAHTILETVNWDGSENKVQYNFKALFAPNSDYVDLSALVPAAPTTAQIMAAIQAVLIAYADTTYSETITAADIYIDGLQYA